MNNLRFMNDKILFRDSLEDFDENNLSYYVGDYGQFDNMIKDYNLDYKKEPYNFYLVLFPNQYHLDIVFTHTDRENINISLNEDESNFIDSILREHKELWSMLCDEWFSYFW